MVELESKNSYHFPNFFTWLHSTTRYIRHPDEITAEDTFTFVMGNESCDLDSFASSCAYAYLLECCKHRPDLLMGTSRTTLFPEHLKQLFNLEDELIYDIPTTSTKLQHHHFIPIITVSKDQFELRGVINRMVQLLDIKHDVTSICDFLPTTEDNGDEHQKKNDIVFDTLMTHLHTSKYGANSISFCLVDHNKPTAILQEFLKLAEQHLNGIGTIQVIGVLDHHVDEHLFTESTIVTSPATPICQQNIPTVPRILYTCASTVTVVINALYSTLQQTLLSNPSHPHKATSQADPAPALGGLAGLSLGLDSSSSGADDHKAFIEDIINNGLFPSTLNENSVPLLDLKYLPPQHPKVVLKGLSPEEVQKIIREREIARANDLTLNQSPHHVGLSNEQYDLLKNHQNILATSLILPGDLMIFTIIIDSVGLEPKHGKRTSHDDLALNYLRHGDLLPPMLSNDLMNPMSPSFPTTPGADDMSTLLLGQQELTTKLFKNLSTLLTDTTNLTIPQLFHLDSKVVEINNAQTNTRYNVLFSAVPKPLGELLESDKYVKNHVTFGNAVDITIPGSELFHSLKNEHELKRFDIILLCTYYQKEAPLPGSTTGQTHMVLQREMLVSTTNFTTSQGQVVDHKKLLQHLADNLSNDAKLGVELYHEQKAKLEKLLSSKCELNDILNTELFVQKNSTLSRKYMLPLISNLITNFE